MAADDDVDKTPKPPPPTPITKAKIRLDQLSSQLPSSTSTPSSTAAPRRRRQKSNNNNDAGPPADHSDILSQITTLQRLASTPPTESRGYIRQKTSGKLWVRERVALLLDEGSLQEVGSLSGTTTWTPSPDGTSETPTAFVPSNSVQGMGLIARRPVLFSADDYSLRAGHADGASWARTQYIEQLALSLRRPIIKLVDGSSGGGSVTTIRRDGYSYVPPLVGFSTIIAQLNAGIPNLGAVLGPAIGLGAARVTLCHFSVMAADVGSLFNAGPKVVANATFEEGLTPAELGGADIHCRNGTIDNVAPNEPAAIAQLRAVLSYLPSCGARHLPPVLPSDDPWTRRDESLRAVIPRNKARAYAMRRIVETLVDAGSWFEIGGLWGVAAVVGLARLSGRPVGIIANDPEQGGGALDAPSSAKIARHLRLCDVMNVPVAQLVDVPGYAVGTGAERGGAMRAGVALAGAYYATSIPIFSVVVRRCYGVAGGAMVDSRAPHMRVAWPSGDWGSLPLAGGIEASHAFELAEVERKQGKEAREGRYRELKVEYERLMNPVRTANAFGIEEIIDPAGTRELLCGWVKVCYETLLVERIEERKAGRLHVAFT